MIDRSFLFKYKRVLSLILFYSVTLCLKSQIIDSTYFGSPIAIPISISGTFGELRPNHFHTGIDIRTNGVEGIPILATADGTISRINVSTKGYGKALYLDHPNNYTSVYAHLSRFTDEIDSFVFRIQRLEQSYEIEKYITPNTFNFKKGDTIGYSGNTGSSQAPHLHFEIRETISEKPINPFHFNIKSMDYYAPIIKRLVIYPSKNSILEITYTNGKVVKKYENQKIILTVNKGKYYYLPGVRDIKLMGSMRVGLESFDKVEENYGYTCQIFKAGLYQDALKKYEHSYSKLNFRYNRFLNSHLDYELYKTKRIKVQKLYSQSLLPVPNIDETFNNGLISIPNNQSKSLISIIVEDFRGNKDSLKFEIKKLNIQSTTKKETITNISPFNTFSFSNDNFSVFIRDSSVSEPTNIEIEQYKELKYKKLSKFYRVGDRLQPIMFPIEIGIKPTIKILNEDTNKVGVMSLYTGFHKAIYKDSKYYSEVKDLGIFWLTLDNISPNISNYNFQNRQNISNLKYLAFKTTDNLSGISKYKAFVDDKFILMEYEPKLKMMYINKSHLPEGEIKLKILVEDEVNNITEKFYELLNY